MTVPMINSMVCCIAMLGAGAAGRRRFSEEEKRRIVDETSQPGCSVSQTDPSGLGAGRSIAKGPAIHWAIVCSLTATAKLNGREPYAYLKDVLERMTNDHPASRLDDLPWNWKPSA